jgi:SagB-type dehydrogenase family enzyme
MKQHLLSACLAVSMAAAVGVPVPWHHAQVAPTGVAESIALPAPRTEGGKPLMQVLNARHSTREFSTEKLSPQTLSNLLWAAFGVNRTDGKRTAPSAVNWQEMDIYVTLPEGAYLYDAKAHRLNLVAPEDLRAATGSQPFVGTAALNLVYVADMAKASKTSPENQAIWVPADAGFIAENVYLFCASEGLNVVVRGMVPRDTLAKALKLRPEQKIMLAQTVGYPKK